MNVPALWRAGSVSCRAPRGWGVSFRRMRLTFIVATVFLSAGTALLVNTVRAEDAAVTRGRMVDLGRQYKTAEALYIALKERGARRQTSDTFDGAGLVRGLHTRPRWDHI